MDQDILNRAFAEARLKIEWAHHCFKDAESLWQRYRESDFCKIREQFDPESGNQAIFIESDPLPLDVVFILADGFHNLSASLDYIVTGMMRASGSPSDVSFPTAMDRHSLRKTFMADSRKACSVCGRKPNRAPNRRIVERFPSFVWLLLMHIKPYRGGNFFVSEIRKLDNINKHNMITPTEFVYELQGIELLDFKYNNRIRLNSKISPGRVGKLVDYWQPDSKLKVHNKGEASASIAFPKSLKVFGGEPVFPTAAQCLKAVREVVDLIQQQGTKPFIRTR